MFDRRAVHLARHVVRRQGEDLPAAGPLLRGRGHQALRGGAVSPAREGFRGAQVPGRGLAGVADRVRRHGAVLHEGRGAYQVRGARGEDPTEPPSSAPYPFPALPHEPRIQQLSDDLAAEGLHPFHAPCGVLTSTIHPAAKRLHPLAGSATASRARCTRSRTPKCWPFAPPSSSPNVTLLTHAPCGQAEHQPRRAPRSPRSPGPARRGRSRL